MNTMTQLGPDNCVTDWVIEHPETLTVFQQHGIDYSCGGKSLSFACEEQGLEVDGVLEALHIAVDGTEE